MKKIYCLAGVMFAFYICYCSISINNQTKVAYIKKQEVIETFKNNKEYFAKVVDYYKPINSRYVLYDLASKRFFSEVHSDEERVIITPICEDFNFNQIEKDEKFLKITYLRPFDHNITIGMAYNYQSEEWEYIYNHNYDRCTQGHMNGYKIFDLIYNDGG